MLRVLATVLLLSTLDVAQEVTIAAAADLSTALPEIAAQYTKQSGVALKLSFGSSGNLTQQIKNGAPFDIFFSADEDYPKQLAQAGLAEPSSLQRYARGRLVLWIPADSTLDIQHRGLEILLEPS